MARRKIIKKADGQKAIRWFEQQMLEMGGVLKYEKLGDEISGTYHVQTPFGCADTSLSYDYGWMLYFQFDAPATAWKGLFGDVPRDWNHELNPHSGKWNLHGDWDVRVDDFIQAVQLRRFELIGVKQAA